MSNRHEEFMALAMEEALAGLQQGEQPFGAVVVRDREVIARARSLKVSTFDVTAHAETLAVGKATRALKTRALTGCTFYSVCEPCPMCCGAIINARVSTLILGARHANLRNIPAGTLHYHDYSVEKLVELTGAGLKVIGGVMEKACEDLYRNAKVPLGY